MKLISCHVENYGNLSDRDFSFDSEITSFCRDNGSGKTTLASFLKAMFYGLDSDRANSKEFCERRHFYPFGGGNFGGSVTFSARGDTFRIERVFDEKSETKDSLTVYRNGKRETWTDKTVGEEFFGIDKASFERTVFITANDIETAPTSSIGAKLNGFTEGSEDGTDLKRALAALEKSRKTYAKSRQGNDLITRATDRINRLSENIANAETVAAGLTEKYKALNEIERTIRRISQQIAAAQSENIAIVDWERYDDMIAQAESHSERAAAIEAKYPCGIPDVEEIGRVASAVACERSLNAEARRKTFDENDEADYARYCRQFSGGLPDRATTDAVSEKIKRRDQLSFEISALENLPTNQNEEVLLRKFSLRFPAEEEIARLSDKAERLKEEEKKWRDASDTPSEASGKRRGKMCSAPYLVVAVLFALLSVVGAVFVASFPYVGVALILCGVAGLVGDGFFYLNKKTEWQTRRASVESSVQSEVAESVRRLTGEINSILLPYGYSSENGAVFAAASFMDDVNDCRALLIRRRENSELAARKRAELAALTEETNEFFLKYGKTGEDFTELLSELISDVNAYLTLCARRENSVKSEADLRERVAANREVIVGFCRRYRLDEEYVESSVKEIEEDEKQYRASLALRDEQRQRAERLKEAKALERRPEGSACDLAALNDGLRAAQEEKNALLTRIGDDEEEAEKLEDLKRERAAAEEKAAEYRARLAVLQTTVKHLVQAENNLKDKYVRPVKEQLVSYVSLLESALDGKITVNGDFEIRFEKNGRERSANHLSDGQRSICTFCFRLALLENMYEEEKPFLILDDPFVHLDEAHMDKVRPLLRELGKRFQMVYFTCHPSRKV